MNNRRTFLLGGATAGAALFNPTNLFSTQVSNSASNVSASRTLQTSHHLLMRQLKKMSKNPRHNPFASGELATAMRFHFTEMQANGTNSQITKAVRQSGAVPIQEHDVTQMFTALERHGIRFPAESKAHMTAQMVAASVHVTPILNRDLQTYSIAKLQRSIHGALVTLGATSRGQMMNAAINRSAHTESGHLTMAAFHADGSGAILRHAGWFGMQAGCDGSDDGWDDGDGGDTIEQTADDDGCDGGGDPSEDPTSSSEIFDAIDAYSSQYGLSYAFGTTFTTPSGTTVNMCTIFWLLAGLSAATWAAALAAAGSNAALGIAAVAANPALAAVILGLMGIYAGYLAVVC